jgi:hypothetical protein
MIALKKLGLFASYGGDPPKYEFLKHTAGPTETIKLYNNLKELLGVTTLEIITLENDWLKVKIPNLDRPIPDAIEDEVWDYATFVPKPLEPLYKTIQEIFPTTLTREEIVRKVDEFIHKKYSLRLVDGKIQLLF